MIGQVKSWTYQKQLQELESIPSPEEIIMISNNIKELRNQCLFILCYLTGGRISELVDRKGIKPENFSKQFVDDREIIVINITNLKNKHRHRKEIPIPLDKEISKELFIKAYEYISSIGYNTLLFDFTRQQAYNIIKKNTGLNPHYMRHIRATHLALYHDFNEFLLVKYMGWTDSRPAKHYMELKWKDILQKL